MDSAPITVDSEICLLFPSLKEKFVVDLVNGIDVSRDHIRVQADRTNFTSRMYDGFTGKSTRRQNEINKNLISGLEGALEWLEDLTESLTFSNLALAKSYEKIGELQNNLAALINYSAGLEKQLNQFADVLNLRCDSLSEEIVRVDFEQRVGRQLEQIFNKWKAGHFTSLSIVGRLYAVIDELWWGDFGDYCRTHNNSLRSDFLRDLKNRVMIRLEEDLKVSSNDRLESDVWLRPPELANPLNQDVQDALDYLGNWAEITIHPFVFSATQQSLVEFPIGLPKLFNGQRLADAMICEVFEDRI